MLFTSESEAIDHLNYLGNQRRPFLFIIDYEKKNNRIEPLPVNPTFIRYKIGELTNTPNQTTSTSPPLQEFFPVSSDFNRYSKAYKKGLDYLKNKTINLLNFTHSFPVQTPHSLTALFEFAEAPYKLFYEDKFIVFSPESFIKINKGKIYSYPMKGTLNAQLPNAREILMNDPKEQEEHRLAVQIIKEDFKAFAKNIKLEYYRNSKLIRTANKNNLWATSSKISGDLPQDYHRQIGSILYSLLPAGSIAGYPKQEALRIIEEIELHKRGFYTGIFGIFDGYSLDSGVMIRFVEQTESGLIYKSGGGVTENSQLQKEFDEAIQKIYVPIH